MTIGSDLSREAKRKINGAIAESNYSGGTLYAPLTFKADEDDDGESFLKPVKFEGFANVGGPDLGDDIVEPSAFSRATLAEYLKFGRQLFFMHDRYSQVGEITAAKQIAKGTRSKFGITEGGLYVEGFVDSPVDTELGMIPDHPFAKIIHFARMQVKRNRLKLLSIGWRPTKTELVKRDDPRRGGEKRTFRHIKALILGEVSLVTMAMSPQSMVELSKAYRGAYGDEIADALFAEDMNEDHLERIPEKIDDFNHERIRELVAGADVAAAAKQLSRDNEGGLSTEGHEDDTDGGNEGDDSAKYEIISLRDTATAKRERSRYKIISLR